MRWWSIACSTAMLALSLAGTAHADEWNKLTYLTFSGPVQMPGVTLPAGTYRFQLADPDSSTADRNRAVGTGGTRAADVAHSGTASRRHLPRTAGELPLYELLSGLALAGSFGIRAFRRR